MSRVMGILLLGVLFGSAALAADAYFPKPASAVMPMYPELARKARVTGSVRLWFVLNDKYEVSDAGIISGHPLLRDAALRSLRTWKFDVGGIKPGQRCETEFVYTLDVQYLKPDLSKLVVTMTDYRSVEIHSELFVPTIE